MNMEIKNKIEAFLSWKTTGIKPEGWDLEPRNKQEMWLAEEAKRLDSIEYGENRGEILRKAPVKAAANTNDYNELEDIPILPMPQDERVEEGKYYYQVGKDIETIISTSEILSKVKFDRTADWNNYLSNLDFQEDSILPIAMGGFEEGICAFDYSKASLMVDSGYAIIYFNPEPEIGEQIEFIYSTVEVNDPRVAPVSIGFQSNVDENGYYNISSESLIPSVVDSSINGTLLKGIYTTNDIIGQCVNGEFKPILLDNGEHSYVHSIRLSAAGYEGWTTLVTNNKAEMEKQDFYDYLYNGGYVDSDHIYGINGHKQIADNPIDYTSSYGVTTATSNNFTVYFSDSSAVISNMYLYDDDVQPLF